MLLCLAAALAAPMTLTASPGGGVGFRGESSGGVVLGTLGTFAATLDLADGTGHFEADPSTLSTGLGPRDQRMLLHTLDVATFPELRYDVTRLERATGGEPSSGVLTLHGTLLLHGVRLPLNVRATLEREGDRLRLRGEVPVSLADFGLPDPSVLIARFGPAVTVTFDLTGVP
jgi:polyisoprenoid-binding protein YceI